MKQKLNKSGNVSHLIYLKTFCSLPVFISNTPLEMIICYNRSDRVYEVNLAICEYVKSFL